MRIILILIAMLASIAIGYAGYMAATYIDETYTEGQAYGFKIGDSKITSYKKAKSQFSGGTVFILYPLEENMHGPHREITLSDSEYQLIMERENWKFYFDEGYYDFLSLRFADNILVEIYRHRKNFEFP